MNIRLYLVPSNNHTLSTRFVITDNYKKIPIKCSIRLIKGSWDQKNQRIKRGFYQAQDSQKKQTTIESLKDKHLDSYHEGGLISELNSQILVDYFAHYNNKYRNQKKPNYLKGLETVKNHLEEFRAGVRFQDVTLSFVEAYKRFLIDKGLRNNTIEINVSRLRTIMRDSFYEGVHKNASFRQMVFKLRKTKELYLTWDEVEQINDCSLKGSELVIRDWFVVNCNLGLRFSDFAKARFQGGQVEVLAPKTGKIHTSPISKMADGILKRYGYELPLFSYDYTNQKVKDIARIAGITGLWADEYYSGANRVEKEMERWEKVTTHTARRTFARRWYDQGGDLLLLSRHLGHSSIITTLNYIGAEHQESSKEMKRLFG